MQSIRSLPESYKAEYQGLEPCDPTRNRSACNVFWPLHRFGSHCTFESGRRSNRIAWLLALASARSVYTLARYTNKFDSDRIQKTRLQGLSETFSVFGSFVYPCSGSLAQPNSTNYQRQHRVVCSGRDLRKPHRKIWHISTVSVFENTSTHV
jgi:hypothetical protein